MGPGFVPHVQEVCGNTITTNRLWKLARGVCVGEVPAPSVGTKELQGAINTNFSSFKRSMDKLSKDNI